jgi:hypothetical protein
MSSAILDAGVWKYQAVACAAPQAAARESGGERRGA